MKADTTEDLRHADLETAKQKMREAFDQFEAYFEQNSDSRTKHVTFGLLDKFEWDLMNIKHLNHHFKQFNILD